MIHDDDDDDDLHEELQDEVLPPEEQLRAQVRWALAKIEHCVAAKQGRDQFAAVVKRAREAFFDDRAIAAGAKQGRFYTNAALMVRESLREAPEVKDALRAVWCTVCSAEVSCREPEISGTLGPLFEHATLSLTTYRTMITNCSLR